MDDFAPVDCVACGGHAEHVISLPTMLVWNVDRRFPNVTPKGDGSMKFSSKDEYYGHLASNHQVEISHDAPKKVKSTSDVTVFD
jgi:hypothetical protein